MKKLLIVCILLAGIFISNFGCTILKGQNTNWQNNVPKLKSDIFMFSKIATRLSLNEADIQPGDTEVIENYIVAIKDILEVPGEPNFDGARVLVDKKLPEKYRVYGLTIIDVLQRYIKTIDIEVAEDDVLIINLISAGLEGALSAVSEFSK